MVQVLEHEDNFMKRFTSTLSQLNELPNVKTLIANMKLNYRTFTRHSADDI